jgi:hypothetical protein
MISATEKLIGQPPIIVAEQVSAIGQGRPRSAPTAENISVPGARDIGLPEALIDKAPKQTPSLRKIQLPQTIVF